MQAKFSISADKLKVVLAFLVVYLVWGSTYIAIRFTLESMPPFLMMAFRFLIAGTVMCVWMGIRGVKAPEKAHLMPSVILGILLLVFGSTGVVLAERSVPSGLVSLLVASVPVFIVLLQWLRPGGTAPSRDVLAGLSLGIIGLIFLVGPDRVATNGGIDIFGVICVLIGSLGSAIGALYARAAKLPQSGPLAAGMQMLAAGLVLTMISACAGEFAFFQHFNVSMKSGLALSYLIVFGSMITYSAYGWLLKNVPPTKVSTYAYVNPVVAVFLGWSLAGEGVTMRTVIGSTILLSAVFLVSRYTSKPSFTPVPLSRACPTVGSGSR